MNRASYKYLKNNQTLVDSDGNFVIKVNSANWKKRALINLVTTRHIPIRQVQYRILSCRSGAIFNTGIDEIEFKW